MMQQRLLELVAPAGIPVQGHQEGQIASADIDVPKLPIDEQRRAIARARKQEIPRMRVTMDDR
jgi:hypothetical protein